jgi:putative ABC transport system permease protein
VTRRIARGWFENVRFALKAMREQKLRSFLTLVGVTVGVATVIMMVSFVVGFDRSVAGAFTAFGTHLVQFQKYEPRFGGGGIPEEQRNRRDLTIEDAEALKRLSKLAKAVSQERYLFATSCPRRPPRGQRAGLRHQPDYAGRPAQEGRFIRPE